MIMRADEEFLPWAELAVLLRELLDAVEQGDCVLIRKLLRKTIDGYVPQGELVDLLYQQRKLAVVDAVE